ncbi:hypothetical protein C0058_19460 [Pseudomonas sp. NC02]|nr:hypothetical protein C0058_19460 [Pseudomonas sp. NC02]
MNCRCRGLWFEYISVSSVTAAYGSALTAGHFWQTPGMPAQPKVTKRSLPHHSMPRLGSACPHSVVLLFCGSWLACDADNSVFQIHRGDAIAGKPAPTFEPCPL